MKSTKINTTQLNYYGKIEIEGNRDKEVLRNANSKYQQS